jgi:hypothetical protein
MRIFVVSDIHFASEEEKSRGRYESKVIPGRFLRGMAHLYRRYIWLRDPFAHNHLLETFCERAAGADLVIANGDYSCDSAFVGVSDPASLASARECLGRLRVRFEDRFRAVMGDHELGKISLFGNCGGPRWASWGLALGELGIHPLWSHTVGGWTFLGLTSTLLALPVYEPECLPEERKEWLALRASYLDDVRRVFGQVPSSSRVVLFVHDPTALPFLAELPEVRSILPRVAATIIGHLHSPVILWQSRVLSGLPPIGFLGNTVRRLSTALSRARSWKPFRVELCPSLAGLELFKDGGFLELIAGERSEGQLRIRRHSLPRESGGRGDRKL